MDAHQRWSAPGDVREDGDGELGAIMKTISARLACAATSMACALFGGALVNAQPAEHKLVQFQMAILKKGPTWDTTKVEQRNATMQKHVASVVALLDSGKAVIAGPFNDQTDLAGIFIFRAAS